MSHDTTIMARSALPASAATTSHVPAAIAASRPTRPGSVSIDMDTLADYAGGYGFEYRLRPDPVYTIGLRRFLDLFRRHGIRATIFVIARDAGVDAHQQVLEQAVRDGHEIANHTLTHPRRLSALSDADRRREICAAHDILSDVAGRPITGFRAPCYDVCPRTLHLLRELNYRYDSSVHPSMIAPVIDAVVLLKSRLRKWEARPGSYRQLCASLRPYRPAPDACWRRACRDRETGRRSRTPTERDLWELPLSAMPYSRLPFYGTWLQTTGMPLFRKSLQWIRKFDVPLNYHFHAVELLGLSDAGVDARFRVHPGMTRPASEKTRDIDEALHRFKAAYNLITLEEMAMGCEASAAGSVA